MKSFFSNKLNILLVVLLVVILGAAGFLGWRMLQPDPLTAIDYSQLTEEEIQAWAENEGLPAEKLKITYQYSDSVEKGMMVSQSPKAGEVIEDRLAIVISQGADPEKKVELPVIAEGMTRVDLEKWFTQNYFSDVTYEYTLDPEHPKDIVLGMNVSGSVSRNTPVLVTLSAGEDAENVKITVPDFHNYTLANIKAWADTNMMNIKYVYVFSDTVPADAVVDQGTREGTEVSPGASITVTVSSGVGISVKDFYKDNAASVRSWANENNINVSFINNYSDTVAEGLVISTSPKAQTTIAAGSTLRVYLSAGPDPSNKKVHVNAEHLDDTEADFLTYIESLGLKAQKQDVSYYSRVIAEGHVYSYDDGDFTADTVISYSLSAGPFEVDLANFEGKSSSAANDYVNNANNLNAHLELETTKEYSSQYDSGTLYGCTSALDGSTTVVSCKLSQGEAPVMYTLPDYVGKADPCGEATSCKIANDHITLQIKGDYSDSVAEGTVLRQDPAAGEVSDGTVVTVTVSLGKKPAPTAEPTPTSAPKPTPTPTPTPDTEATAYVPSLDDLNSHNTSYEDATAFVRQTLSAFSNVQINGITSQDYIRGNLISVSVGGNTAYEPGQYKVSTPIVVTISTGFE